MTTRQEVLELIQGHEDKPDDFIVQLTIRCRRRPRSRVRLWSRTGPWSAGGRSIAWEHGQATAWWTIGDLRATLKPREPTKAELLEFVAEVRSACFLADEVLAVASQKALIRLDAKLDRWPSDLAKPKPRTSPAPAPKTVAPRTSPADQDHPR